MRGGLLGGWVTLAFTPAPELVPFLPWVHWTLEVDGQTWATAPHGAVDASGGVPPADGFRAMRDLLTVYSLCGFEFPRDASLGQGLAEGTATLRPVLEQSGTALPALETSFTVDCPHFGSDGGTGKISDPGVGVGPYPDDGPPAQGQGVLAVGRRSVGAGHARGPAPLASQGSVALSHVSRVACLKAMTTRGWKALAVVGTFMVGGGLARPPSAEACAGSVCDPGEVPRLPARSAVVPANVPALVTLPSPSTAWKPKTCTCARRTAPTSRPASFRALVTEAG